MKADIYIGDCRDVLAGMPADTFHAVVCDPPYELNFMNCPWDRRGIAFDPEFWREVLRVLRPGGHLVAFGGTRTHHRMYCAIEDAGFEIRDSLAYMFGSGFPKSLDVSKAIDKAAGAVRPVVGDKLDRPGYHLHGHSGGEAFSAGLSNSTPESRLASALVTAPATAEAEIWSGYGTALKPAYEPICLARKPLSESSVAKNVLRWGTGALNIDGCRIEATDGYTENAVLQGINTAQTSYAPASVRRTFEPSNVGRWPANVCLDEEAAAMLDEQSGVSVSRQGAPRASAIPGNGYGMTATGAEYSDTGGASRFFFTAKPSVAEREDGLAHVAPRTRNRVNAGGLENDPKWAPTTRRNTHPTVKPFDLMSWLVRLVTPPGGIVCDPFLGSGTTGMAAVAEGFDFIGIEQDAGFAEIAEGRIRNVAPLLIATKIHTTAESGSLSGSVVKAATSDLSGPKPGTAGVRSPGGD